MKKIGLILILIGLFTGCERQDIVYGNQQYLIIKEMSISDSDHQGFSNYKYTVNDGCNDCIFYLNAKYSVGDTLVITKK